MGRGTNRRLRKRGLKQKMSRPEMVCGPYRCYKIVYDLKPGDIFRFRARHKAVNVHKELARARTKNWLLDDQEDFPAGTHIVWTGADWLTPNGHFLPRKYWWPQFGIVADPVSVVVPKKVSLRLWNPPKTKKIFPPPEEVVVTTIKKPSAGATALVDSIKKFFGK